MIQDPDNSVGAEGFVVVPREPTEEMLMAAGIASKVVGHDDQGRRTTRYLAVELTATIYIAMISAAPDQPGHEGGWKDIASAPKDGTPILGFVPTFSEPCIVLIDWVTFDGSDKPGYWADRWSDAGDEIEDAPTHWQPLPTRPTHTKEG